jgi:Ig domain of plant-specific actin-binding protein
MTTRAILSGALLAALLIPAAGSAGLRTAPKATGQPRVSGRTVQGQTLFTTNGSWSGTRPFAFRYRWLRCDASGGGVDGVNCNTIPGATRRTYVQRLADVGHRIRSRVVVSNADGTASANSNATPGVVQPSSAAGAPLNASPPAISGTPQQNQTLSATTGTWNGAKPQAYSFQWRRCDAVGGNCADIAGATASTYAPSADDVGHALRVRVTARNSLGARSSTSTPTGVVAKASLPSGQTISINDVALPNRLVIDRLQFVPLFLRSRAPFTARFHVSDSQGHPVQGALVFVVGIPFGNTTTPPEQATGADGWVTFTIRPTFRLPLVPRGNQPFFVRARKPGERLIAGVSTRRLVNLSVRA